MNGESDSIVDRQVDAMLKLVRRHQASAAAKILDQAHGLAAERLARARSQARRHVHQAVEKMRSEVEAQLRRVRSLEQAREREQRLDKAGAALEAGWGLLAESIERRWSDADSRQLWYRSLIGQAAQTLPAGGWIIEHPEALPEEDRKAIRELAEQATDATPRLVAVADIAAGLRIRVDEACLDGTLDGLLARRPELEARLLAGFLAHEASSDGQDAR